MKDTNAFRTKLRETIYKVLKEQEEEEEVEASEEESETVDTDVSISDEETVETDVEEKDTGVVLKMSPTIQGLQKDLQDAFAAAEQLGDTKLVTQIGNTITYFTRTHVVGAAEEVNESKKSRLTNKIFESLKKKLRKESIEALAEKAYPFNKCLNDNEGKYGKEGAKKVCGAIKAAYGEGLEEGVPKGYFKKEHGVGKDKVDESDDWIQHAIKRPGALHRELGVPQDEDIPKWKMDAAEDRLEDEERRDHAAGRDMSAADRRELRQIDLARTLEKFTENKSSKKKSVKENLRRKRKNVRRK